MSSQPSRNRVVRLPPEGPGESEIIRSGLTHGTLIEYAEGVTTLWESFSRSAGKVKHNNCLGWRIGEGPYKWMSYQTTFERALNVGCGLVKLGFVPHVDNVGIYSINRPEWILTEQGCNAFSLCLVPLYDTLGHNACSFIINHAELRVVVCSADKIKQLLESLNETPKLKILISIGAVSTENAELAGKLSVDLMSFDDLEKLGKENSVQPDPPKKDEVCTICYTSGTTGTPKGVLLTHANFIANIAASQIVFHASSNDVHCSYLPLAHVYERLITSIVFLVGGSVGFYRGDISKLMDDLQCLRPTVFVSVPRIWNRFYHVSLSKLHTMGGLYSFMFNLAFEKKKEGLMEGKFTHAVWDYLVFKSIREKVGDRVRALISGSAPLSHDVKEFLMICFGCPVLEGYGQTEVAASASVTMQEDTDTNHVGVPLPSVEIKLVDVPEMGYHASHVPPRGEICIRGPSVTKGYHKDPERTAETIDKNGWLHSGDIGAILPDGSLKVLDRKNNLFKLSLGEYIAPDKLETIYQGSEFVSQCFIHGDPFKSSIIAIVVIDIQAITKWAYFSGQISIQTMENPTELCRNPLVIQHVLEDMVAVGKRAHLKTFELVKAIHLTPIEFSAEILTPTMKIKRFFARKHFKAIIDSLYDALD